MQWLSRAIANIAHLPDPDAPHTAVDLSRYTAANVVITSDPNSRMLLLSMDSRDPQYAKTFLLDLVNATNDFIKDQDNAIAKNQCRVCDPAVENQHRSCAARRPDQPAWRSEESHLMFTAVDLPYVAGIQDGPIVDVSNSAVKFLAAYTMLGFLAGAGIGVAMTFVPKNKRPWRRFWTRS